MTIINGNHVENLITNKSIGRIVEKKMKALDNIDIPQMIDNEISLDSIESADGVYLRVMRYSNPSRGDIIKIFWGNDNVKLVSLNDVSADLPVVVKITDNINEGDHYASYTIKDNANNENSSEVTRVCIVNKRHSSFEPPVFINAVNHVLTQENIHINNGTTILIAPENNLKKDDVVNLFISAADESGVNVFNATFNQVISYNDVNIGVRFFIHEPVLKKLTGCHLSAYYHIMHLKSLIGISKKAQIKITEERLKNKLKIYSSTGAVNIDKESILVTPYNHGILIGNPGAQVSLSVTTGAEFYESGASTHNVILNNDGVSNFKISAKRQGSYVISAFDILHPEIKAELYTINFKPYYYENELVPYLNYSTGAPADGFTPCTIYLKTAKFSKFLKNEEINIVRVTIDGDANIVGYASKSADISLHTDQSAEIYIVSRSPGIKNVTITIPQSTGTPVRFPLSFVSITNKDL